MNAPVEKNSGTMRLSKIERSFALYLREQLKRETIARVVRAEG